MRSHAIFTNALLRRCVLCFLAGLVFPAYAQEHPPADLIEMSLEELMNVEVITAGKKEQPLAQVPAAVYVITQEEIRRSGATRLPELLRLAPGVQVAQINANTWAISIRGFNYRYSNKLLVMIDGRTVYSPDFSGVYWDMQNLVLEDIERIEVIRGPGGTLWGANAVNGVINVITKRAQDTQGALFTATTGSQGEAMTQARYGGQNQQKQFSYRLYGKYFREGQSPYLDRAHTAYDAWSDFIGGFRSDWQAARRDNMVFSGQIYRTSEQQFYLAPLLEPPFSQPLNTQLKGTEANLTLKWQHQFTGGSRSTLQTYYDHLDRFFPALGLQQQVLDIDLQHQLHLARRHEIVVGAGFRFNHENICNSDFLSFLKRTGTLNIFAGSLQDEITLRHDLWLTAGSKFESNSYTGVEAQPGLRLLWKPYPKHALWSAVSRAVRTPSTYEEQVRINALAFPGPNGLPVLLAIFGNSRLLSEQILAYELGYRTQPTRTVSIDVAAFYDVYKDLVGLAAGQPFLELTPTPPHMVIPSTLSNNAKARTKGLEFSGTYQPLAWWRISTAYSWLEIREHAPAGSGNLMQPGDSPRHQFNLRSYWSLPLDLEFDTAAFYNGALSAQAVPGCVRFDTRLGWHPNKHLAFSLALQNLLHPRHPEFVQTYDVQGPAQVGRRVQGGITWHF